MNARFASVVDPIFLFALQAVQQLDQGRQIGPLELSRDVQQRIAAGDTLLGSEPKWQLAKYALVAWIDEMLVNHAWSGSKWWSNNVLEAQLFQSRLCSVRFFDLAKQATGLPDRDALEVFHLCVIMGFRGMYGPTGELPETVGNASYPVSLTTWLRAVDRLLSSASLNLEDDGSSMVSAQPTWAAIAGTPPHHGRQQILMWSVGVTLLLIINLIVFQV